MPDTAAPVAADPSTAPAGPASPASAPPPAVSPATTTPAEGGDPETFPRAYVEDLRRESAGYRDRARLADALGRRLHVALVAATGRLADPTDLPYEQAHLDDPAALEAAIADLVARKPHLADRRPAGDVGQGATPEDPPLSLLGLLRGA